jgi:succinate--hydroxymethylglutarate CoA-transferase
MLMHYLSTRLSITSPSRLLSAATSPWGPLRGIRVLDLSRVLAGPYCCQILGDMGADVIKVEQPGIGDETRRWGPPFVHGESSYFISVNRNKKSICVDLKAKEGAEIIKRLAAVSDVIVENFLPTKLAEMGLDYDSLKIINPKLIYCSITGFGTTGPYASRPGYDALISAMYGMIHITGPDGGAGVRPGVALTDVMTGLLAHGGILASLREREISGLGQRVDTSLMEAQLSSLVNIASNFLTTGKDNSRRMGTAHPSIVPYQTFTCSDGNSLMVAIGNNKQFALFCGGLKMPNLPRDERFLTNELRVQHRHELLAIISDAMSLRTLDEWLSEFDGLDFPFGPVRSIKESFEDKQAIHRNMTATVEHPTCGSIGVVGVPVKYSRTPCEIRLPPPLRGQHTIEVLKNLISYSDETIKHLITSNIIEDGGDISMI